MEVNVKNEYSNQLIYEKSPYLLQHAHNPVNWYSWSEEAFSKAVKEDKPIFLSIGYSTCHWCHVMERESFEDDQIAGLLNKHFISIKVDREERPDIDAVYMSVCQILTGSGGWPLTILMTPDQKPFYAATYLPKTNRYQNIGLFELLTELNRLWLSDRSKLLDAGNEIIEFINHQKNATRKVGVLEKDLLEKAAAQFKNNFDQIHGGFGTAPKFPTPHNLLFLLRYAKLEHSSICQQMAEKTLIQMYRGGIFDHIGGGFSRYSTDSQWLVPHFEKMLYDNALLSLVYLEAFQITKKPLYRHISEVTLQYVNRELTDKLGGFYCGQDADSEGVEGKYYVFTPKEIISVLGQNDGNEFCRYFNVTEAGNFEGKSILNLLENSNYEILDNKIRSLCKILYEYRLERTKLHKDDKVLTSWNSLMIVSFAKAALVLEDESYLYMAEKAQKFIAENLVDENGHLLVRWREGEAGHQGHLDDYAFYVWALLSLYEATFAAIYLQDAIHIASEMVSLFFDEEEGGFYLYSSLGEQLIDRPKEIYDGAIPSGNSVASLVLGVLFQFTGDPKWQEYRDKQLQFLAASIHSYPTAYSFALIALMNVFYPTKELVCSSFDATVMIDLQKLFSQNSFPNLATLVKLPENEITLDSIAEYTRNYPIPDEGAAFYLCKDGSCNAPVFDIQELKELLLYN